jgi:hypothetical protein
MGLAIFTNPIISLLVKCGEILTICMLIWKYNSWCKTITNMGGWIFPLSTTKLTVINVLLNKGKKSI